jgi:hypothetical protein
MIFFLQFNNGCRAGLLVTFLASGGTLSANDLLRGTEPLKTAHPSKVLGTAEHLLRLEHLRRGT